MPAAQFIRNDATAGSLLQGRAGKLVKALVEGGQLRELVVRGPVEAGDDIARHFLRVTHHPPAGRALCQLSVRREVLPLEVVPQMAFWRDPVVFVCCRRRCQHSRGRDQPGRRNLRQRHRLPPRAAQGRQLQRALRNPSGRWRARHLAGSTGRVLAARFINKDEVHNAVWFQEAGRKGTYFDLRGRSKVRAFMASPLAFSRVTSGFAMRFHPILQKWRAHLGVDFGAPTGTPVRTVGEGVVAFAGRQNGYGNVVQVQHSGERMTVYAHLSRIDVRVGQRLEQGTRIWRGGRHRLGHRPASALRVQDQWPPG